MNQSDDEDDDFGELIEAATSILVENQERSSQSLTTEDREVLQKSRQFVERIESTAEQQGGEAEQQALHRRPEGASNELIKYRNLLMQVAHVYRRHAGQILDDATRF